MRSPLLFSESEKAPPETPNVCQITAAKLEPSTLELSNAEVAISQQQSLLK